jgi:hypothetical protein
MENKTTALTADNAMTRRSLLAALGASAAAVAAPTNEAAAALAPLNALAQAESPALAAAYGALLEAHAKHLDAKNALEWLADEWKHRWPLAPVQILGLPNADRYHLDDSKAERDLIWRYIYRDNAEMRDRVSTEFIAKTPKTCWSVQTADELAKLAEFWDGAKVRGKSDASRAKSAAYNAKQAQKAREAIPLAIEYERQTAEVSRLSGVNAYHCRLAETRDEMRRAANHLYSIPVTTARGIQIKAEALKITNPEVFQLTEIGGLGPLLRIAQDAIALNEVSA